MPHPLLKSLRASSPAFGAWLTFPSVHTARQVALAGRMAGLSWVSIDCEHGQTSLVPGVADTIAAIASLPRNPRNLDVENPSVLVRIPAPGIQYSAPSTTYQIKSVLDAGAHGIIVPMVSTGAIARQIALDARFPPAGMIYASNDHYRSGLRDEWAGAGRRGFGSPFTHQIWGLDDPLEYLSSRANDEVVVCVQIENQESIKNLEEIAQTEGVDVLFIGAFDLSLSLGYPTPNPDPHPEVEEVIQRIKEVAHKYNKKVAYYCTSGTQAKKRAEEGFDIINVSSDASALVEGITRNLEDAVGKISKPGKKSGY